MPGTVLVAEGAAVKPRVSSLTEPIFFNEMDDNVVSLQSVCPLPDGPAVKFILHLSQRLSASVHFSAFPWDRDKALHKFTFGLASPNKASGSLAS